MIGRIKNLIVENDEIKGILEISDKDTITDIKSRKIKGVSIYIPRSVCISFRKEEMRNDSMKNTDNIEDQKEDIGDLREIIRKQNQALLHIKAELDSAKQFNPFNLVLISGSMENISNIVEDHFKPVIDEECVGCCKVVDVAAKLQKELDECSNMNLSLHEDIEELKDKNIEDLHELYDLYEKELYGLKNIISARDLTIKSLTTMCQSSGTELKSVKSDRDIMYQNYHNVIAKLQDDIKDLERELCVHRRSVNTKNNTIKDLEAELFVRKGILRCL